MVNILMIMIGFNIGMLFMMIVGEVTILKDKEK